MRASTLLHNSQQCIVVVTDSWSSPHAVICRCERDRDSSWKRVGETAPALVGRAGLGWGRGEMDVAGLAGPTKHEGDDKAPAGIFRLGTSFGYSARSPSTRMPYLHLTNNIVAVDDSKSRYYNQLVDTSKIKGADWRTAENMILGDDRYKWGLVVLHNVPPTPGVGSCIFLHVWKDASTATSGCTAMSQNTLVNLLHWLDPAKSPRLIQLPRSIYKEMREGWALPPL